MSKEFKDSRYVFVAQVEKSRDVFGPRSLIDGTYYTLRITENLKGHPDLRTEVFSENTTARFPMDVGASYLLFVDRQRSDVTRSSEFVIDSCGNSGPIASQKKVLAQVRKAAAPEEHYFRYPPRLWKSQAVAFVERAAKLNGRNLVEYKLGPGGVRYDDKERRWIALYVGLDRLVGNHFMVTVSDLSGKASYIPGR